MTSNDLIQSRAYDVAHRLMQWSGFPIIVAVDRQVMVETRHPAGRPVVVEISSPSLLVGSVDERWLDILREAIDGGLTIRRDLFQSRRAEAYRKAVESGQMRRRR